MNSPARLKERCRLGRMLLVLAPVVAGAARLEASGSVAFEPLPSLSPSSRLASRLVADRGDVYFLFPSFAREPFSLGEEHRRLLRGTERSWAEARAFYERLGAREKACLLNILVKLEQMPWVTPTGQPVNLLSYLVGVKEVRKDRVFIEAKPALESVLQANSSSDPSAKAILGRPRSTPYHRARLMYREREAPMGSLDIGTFWVAPRRKGRYRFYVEVDIDRFNPRFSSKTRKLHDKEIRGHLFSSTNHLRDVPPILLAEGYRLMFFRYRRADSAGSFRLDTDCARLERAVWKIERLRRGNHWNRERNHQALCSAQREARSGTIACCSRFRRSRLLLRRDGKPDPLLKVLPKRLLAVGDPRT